MKSLLFTPIIVFIISCRSYSTSDKSASVAAGKTESAVSTAPVAPPATIDYEDLETFAGQQGLYSFKVPRGLFLKSGEDEYSSKALNAQIKIEHQYTQWLDEKGIFSKRDLIKKYKSEVKPSYFAEKDDWFALSGYDANNNILYMKGFYDELSSMQGNDAGEPKWLWSKSAVLKISYTEDNKEEFDKLVPLITRSFTCDFSVY